jgi:mannose-6-phosphate isomerase-like protein (cupin superfamily)
MSEAMDSATGLVVGTGQGEALDVFGAGLVVKADPARFGGLVAEHLVPPGYMVPPHTHDRDDELFFMLEGALTLLGPSGEERRIGLGDTAVLPRGSVHGFRNDGPMPARCLVLVTPGLQAIEMFRHFDRASGAAGPSGLAPADIVSVAGQYGVRMVG